MNQSPQATLVLCRDLLFASKITSTAGAIGAQIKLIRDVSKLESESNSNRLIVDLTQDGFIDAAVRWKQRTGGQVTGFAGHADVQTIERAQLAGIDRVLSRGEFSSNLPHILQGT